MRRTECIWTKSLSRFLPEAAVEVVVVVVVEAGVEVERLIQFLRELYLM